MPFNLFWKKLFFLVFLILFESSLNFQISTAADQESKFKLYDIKHSSSAYMYVIQTETVNGKMVRRWVPTINEAKEKWGLDLNEHDLVYAEEVQDKDGNNFLRIPYNSSNSPQNKDEESTAYFLLREYNNNQHVEKDHVNPVNYKPALPGEKRTGAYFSNSEDTIVYLDMPYHDLLPLTDEPNGDSSKCKEGMSSLKCPGWPSSQEKLKVLESRPIRKRDPETGKVSMELYYYVETQYKRKTCGINDDLEEEEKAHYCPEKTFKVKGWMPASRALDFKRQDTYPGEEIFAYTDEELRQFEMAIKRLKDQECQFAKSMRSGLEDMHLTLDEALRFPFKKEDIGKCTDEAKRFIQKMKATIAANEDIYNEKIKAEESKKKPNWNKINDLEVERSQKELSKLNQLWRSNKTPFDEFIRDYWDERYSKPSESKNRFLTKDQMISIDALARSLYGEMRESGCSSRTSSYYKEIARVMFNRAALIKKKNGPIEKFISQESLNRIGEPKDASIFKILPDVISSPYQISSWNANDHNLMVNLCPDPKRPEDKAAWKLAKSVAIEAVVNTEKFLDETKEVQSVFYASKIRPFWENDSRFSKMGAINLKHQLVNEHTQSVDVYNVMVNNPDCVKLYKDTDYNQEIKEMHSQPKTYYSQLFLDLMNFPQNYHEILLGMSFEK